MAIRAVAAIVPALWLLVDRVASTQMGEPLTWDEIPNRDNDSGGGRSMATDFRRALARVDDLLHVQRPDGLQLVAGLHRAISVWRELNEVPSRVARKEFRSDD